MFFDNQLPPSEKDSHPFPDPFLNPHPTPKQQPNLKHSFQTHNTKNTSHPSKINDNFIKFNLNRKNYLDLDDYEVYKNNKIII